MPLSRQRHGVRQSSAALGRGLRYGQSAEKSGLSCPASAAGTTVYSTWFLSASISTTAIVNEIIVRKDDEGNTSRTTLYTYRDGTGASHKGETSLSGGHPSAAGDVIPVRYLRSSPGGSRIDTFLHHWFAPLLLAGWSIFTGSLGFGLRWWRRREQQWADKRLPTSATVGPVHE